MDISNIGNLIMGSNTIKLLVPNNSNQVNVNVRLWLADVQTGLNLPHQSQITNKFLTKYKSKKKKKLLS